MSHESRKGPPKRNRKIEGDLAREGCTAYRFKGVEPYWYLFDTGRIAAYFTGIRIMYSGDIDTVYFPNEEGLLMNPRHDDQDPKKPENVLNLKNAPDGWDVDRGQLRNMDD
jgi:hypothetical protein